MRAFRRIPVRVAFAVLAATLPLWAAACSSDPTGVDDEQAEACRTVGVLVICGADTTRVEGG